MLITPLSLTMNMNFCVICGHKTTEKIPLGDHQLRRVCTDCGNIHYINPKVICGALVLWENKVLLCRRAIEPRYGLWTLPAGYMELFETMEQGAARETQRAERQKAVELVAAKQAAEKDAIAITVAAEAGKQAAADDAEAVRIAAEAQAEQARLKAKGEADAKILLAQAMEKQYQVDADGTRAVNEANNVLSPEQVEMQIRLALLKYLPEIIRESVKPMENIDDIKILQVNGLGNVGSATTGGDGAESSQVALSDQVVNSALRYRTQAPLIDSLMNELGIQGGDINGLTQSLKPQSKAQ